MKYSIEDVDRIRQGVRLIYRTRALNEYALPPYAYVESETQTYMLAGVDSQEFLEYALSVYRTAREKRQDRQRYAAQRAAEFLAAREKERANAPARRFMNWLKDYFIGKRT